MSDKTGIAKSSESQNSSRFRDTSHASACGDSWHHELWFSSNTARIVSLVVSVIMCSPSLRQPSVSVFCACLLLNTGGTSRIGKRIHKEQAFVACLGSSGTGRALFPAQFRWSNSHWHAQVHVAALSLSHKHKHDHDSEDPLNAVSRHLK